MESRKLLAYCRSDLSNTMSLLRQAVEMETPTYSRPDIDRLAGFLAREFRRHGANVLMLDNPSTGAALVAEFWGNARTAVRRGSNRHDRAESQRPILLLGHLDTVWPRRTLGRMPFRIRGGRAYGPGILDMKSGIVLGLAAIRALQAIGIEPPGPVRFFLNPEEETGSGAFRREIEREAKASRAVLILEPAAKGGALKTARKGVGEFQLTVRGRSAHAGIDPDAGINAIGELARQILKVEKFAAPRRGLTLNAGVIEGGTRPNVVPDFASATVDVRIMRTADGEWVERKFWRLKPVNRGARLKITGGINRPPMERAMTAALFAKAKDLAMDLGFGIKEAASGGGSDGSFCAALGIPTLDGLGGVGDGPHADHEHVVIRELPRRAALLAALLAEP